MKLFGNGDQVIAIVALGLCVAAVFVSGVAIGILVATFIR